MFCGEGGDRTSQNLFSCEVSRSVQGAASCGDDQLPSRDDQNEDGNVYPKGQNGLLLFHNPS